MRYPLLPYSQLVFDMLKTDPDVYTYRTRVRISKSDVDTVQFNHAIRAALTNHPVFRMAVDEQGMQHFNALADPMHGQYACMEMQEDSVYLYIDFTFNRILGDAISENIFLEDFLRAYRGLPLAPDNYLNYLQGIEDLKQSERYAADRQWLEERFGNLNCPVHPKTDTPLSTPMTTEGTLTDNYSDLRDRINRVSTKRLITITAFVSLAAALAMMDYNGTDEVALTWAYEGRETEEEQHIYGSLHRDVPFKISRKSKVESQKQATRDELLRQTRKAMREGVAHSSYPFTLIPPHNELWNYALNVLVQPTSEAIAATIPFAFEVLPTEQSDKAYALLDMDIYDSTALTINYRYSTAHYREESVRKFAGLVRKYAEWLLKDEN